MSTLGLEYVSGDVAIDVGGEWLRANNIGIRAKGQSTLIENLWQSMGARAPFQTRPCQRDLTKSHS